MRPEYGKRRQSEKPMTHLHTFAPQQNFANSSGYIYRKNSNIAAQGE